MIESKPITEHSPAPWGLEGEGGYDYKWVWGSFGGQGLIHYFHYGTDVRVVRKPKLNETAHLNTRSLLQFNYTSKKLLKSVCTAMRSSGYQSLLGIQQNRAKLDSGSHHAGASLSLLPVRKTFHASHSRSLWLISGWGNCGQVFKPVKPKQEAGDGQISCHTLSGRPVDLLTPSLTAYFLPADSTEDCSRARGPASLPTLRILLSSSWKLKTVLQKKQNHDKRQQRGLTQDFNGKICMNKGKMKDSK